MSNEGRIDEIISESSYKQIDRLKTELRQTDQLFIDNAKSILIMNNAMASAGSLKQFTEQTAKINQAFEKQAKNAENAARAEAKIAKERERTRLSEIRLEQVREKAFDKYEAQLKKQEQAQLRANAAAAKAASPFNQLAASLAKAEKEALDLGAALGVDSKEFIEAAANVQKLRAQVDGLETPLGKFQRNVGNYKTGFNGLSNSINQLTREFPAFTYSVQTGFMALSNNIPIFIDQIQETNHQIKMMRAEGKEVPGLLKQIASAIFSWATALGIVITLFTVFGKEIGEFVTSIFKGKDAMDAFISRQKALGEAMKETSYVDAIRNVNELRINIDLAKKGLLDKESVLKQYNETIGKTTGEVKSLDEAEKQLGLNSDAYIKMTLLKAAAQLALGKAAQAAADAQFKRQEKPEENISFFDRLLSVAQLGPEAFTKTFDETLKRGGESVRDNAAMQLDELERFFANAGATLQKEAAELSKLWGFDFFGGEMEDKSKNKTVLNDLIELNRARIEAAKEAAERIYTNEKEPLNKRLKALSDYSRLSESLVKNRLQAELTEKDISANKIKALEIRANSDIINIQTESRNKADQLRKEDFDKTISELEKQHNDQIRSAKEADEKLLRGLMATSEQRQLLLSEAADNAIFELTREFANGEIKAKDYAKKRLQIQHDVTIALINEELRAVSEIIDLQRRAGQDTAANEKKLAELKQRLSKETTAAQIADLETLAKRESELKDKRKELALEVANFGFSLIEGSFVRAQDVLKKEDEQNEIRKAKEIEAVQKSLATEEEKSNRITLINARAQSQKEALERRQRQLDVEKARFDRLKTIANIIGSTASAVAEALPNIPLSILVGAIGAVQLATAIAAPIPKYEVGTDYSQGGPAWVGEKGTELMIDPSGKLSLTPDKATLTHLQEGTKIINNQTLKRMIINEQFTGVGSSASRGGMSEVLLGKLIKNTEDLKSVFKDQKVHGTMITKGGMKHIHLKGADWNKYVKNNM